MLRKNKNTLIITSILTVLPILIGLILWNKLPDEIATHYTMDGTPDGWSSKAFAVFVPTLICLAAHLICSLATAADPKAQNVTGKMLSLVYWICPCVSLLVGIAMYGEALGIGINAALIIKIFVGVMLVIAGNYLPKCRQNYTIGIKLPWTLASEENWNRTHRLAGWIWVPCGLFFIINAFLNIGGLWLFLILLFMMVIIPTVYSAVIYKK